jgi:hypoxanthine-DNA glycosylase
MIEEVHPFGSFLTENTKIVITGTFPGRFFAQRSAEENEADELAFSYAGRNQFWKILEKIYDIQLSNRAEKKDFLRSKNIGLMDLYHTIKRKKQSNLDTDLLIVKDNRAAFETLFEEKKIEKIFCTGKGVAQILEKWFPEKKEKIVALPSPSPLYAAMTFQQKTEIYRELLLAF